MSSRLFALALVGITIVAVSFSVDFGSSPDNARREYDSEGRLVSISEHDSEGLPHGVVTTFYTSGRKMSVTRFHHGSWVSHTEFLPDGSSRRK